MIIGIGLTLRATLLGSTAVSDPYEVAGFSPPLVFDFAEEFYRTAGSTTTFDAAMTHARSGNATMVDASGAIQTVSTDEPRVGHHIWNGSSWINAGYLHESEVRVQLLHTTNALVTQSHTVTAVPHTLHFTGTGTVTLSGASTAGPLVGTGTGENNRVSLTFTPTAASLTLTVSGTVTNAQLEVGSTPSSYIPNLSASGTVTRAADTITVPYANLPWPTEAPLSVSIQMDGKMTYADDGSSINLVNWASGSPRIQAIVVTSGALTGRPDFIQSDGFFADVVSGVGSYYSPGINVPFNIASRHGSTFINGAVSGTALTADTTPTALPALSAANLQLGFDYMGTIKTLRMWANDLGDTGIAEASA